MIPPLSGSTHSLPKNYHQSTARIAQSPSEELRLENRPGRFLPQTTEPGLPRITRDSSIQPRGKECHETRKTGSIPGPRHFHIRNSGFFRLSGHDRYLESRLGFPVRQPKSIPNRDRYSRFRPRPSFPDRQMADDRSVRAELFRPSRTQPRIRDHSSILPVSASAC